MENNILSKSDFKVAQSCPCKLYYKKKGYPTSKDEDDYLLMLADGGYMVGKMAQILFSKGIDLSKEINTKLAITKTEALLSKQSVTLFEPAIYSNQKLIRIDILQKDNKALKLIEVKSKSFNSVEYKEAKEKNKKYFELSTWQEYIEDVAFQKYVLQEKYPEYQVQAYLLLPDKSKKTSIDGLIDWFKIKNVTIKGENRFRDVEVEFTGDIDQLKDDHILNLVNVDEYVDKTIETIAGNIESYIESLNRNEKIIIPISTQCKKCEYITTSKGYSTSGFSECWGKLANVKPHLLELTQLGNFNRGKAKAIDKLISQKKVSLNDVPLELVKEKYNNRAYYQITTKEEFLLKGFSDVLNKIEYPLYFIDFETSQMVLPYHAGMRPYGKVLFQWSCHKIEKKGATPIHYEWINTSKKFPNFEFANSLREVIGDLGSIMIWSLYENSMLKDVLNSFDDFNHDNQDLKQWLSNTIDFGNSSNSRIVDLNDVALKNYYHPMTNGKTSIKKILPAVLSATKSKTIIDLLISAGLYKNDEGNIIDPYQLLPNIEIAGKILNVSDGTDAMLAYQEIMYGINSDNKSYIFSMKDCLLNYCKLDTLAMVIIWEHWNNLISNKH